MGKTLQSEKRWKGKKRESQADQEKEEMVVAKEANLRVGTA